MLRKHSTSYKIAGPQNKKSQQHCRQDLACRQCCSSCKNHKKQLQIRIKINQDRYIQQKNHKQTTIKLNKQLVRDLEKLKSILRQHQNLDDLKQSIRERLIEQVKKEVEVELLVKQEKIKDLEIINKNITQKLQHYVLQNGEMDEKIRKLGSEVEENEEQISRLSAQNQQMKLKCGQLQNNLQKTNQRVYLLQQAIKNKTNIIDKFEKTCSQLQNRYALIKTQASNMEFDNKVLQANNKANQNYINQLNQNCENTMKNMNNLQQNNEDMKSLMARMNLELHDGRMTEDYLKERLAWSESMANYNSQKVQMMKADVNMLRYKL